MSEKIKTAVIEIIKAHMQGEDKNTKAVLSDVMESVNELETLEQEPCDDATPKDIFCIGCDYKEQEHCTHWKNGKCNGNIEPCDDAISREWLMRKATERFYTTNYFNHISAMIEEAPPVTQKSGKWIDKDVRKEEYVLIGKCSVCGQVRVKDKFCPNCGAKMESEE